MSISVEATLRKVEETAKKIGRRSLKNKFLEAIGKVCVKALREYEELKMGEREKEASEVLQGLMRAVAGIEGGLPSHFIELANKLAIDTADDQDRLSGILAALLADPF